MTVVNPNPAEIQDILTNSKTVAVVGLSDKPERTSYQISRAMLDAGFEIIPVNPNITSVFGIQAVPSLKHIDKPVDIVNVFRRPEFLLDVAKGTAEIGAKVYWAQLGLVSGEAYDYLTERDVTVVMDRCIKVEHAKIKK